MPQADLKELLAGTTIYASDHDTGIIYGEDSAIVRVTGEMAMIQNIDIFTPIVDDPFVQGQIAACNVTNDVFACGATEITHLLAFLAAPVDLPRWALAEMMNGMQAFVKSLGPGAGIAGGHTVINPWVLVGGVATGLARVADIITHDGVRPGDVLVLTKPLGIQPAMGLSRLLKRPEFVDEVRAFMTDDEMHEIVQRAIALMVTSNKPVAEVVRALGKERVHAMTDVTGFGLLGHAENLASASKVDIEITSLPHLRHGMELADLFGYELKGGRSAETAGGMLVAVAPAAVATFRTMLDERGVFNAIVGSAREGPGVAWLASNVEYLAV